MDYIREELLRQRNILSLLMIGGRNGEPEKNGDEGDEIPESGRSSAQQDNRYQTLWRTDLMSGLSGRRMWSADGTEENHRSGFWNDRGLKRHMKPLAIAEDEAESFRTVLYEPMVSGTVVGVRELSRSIQRDARRYDGGFTIY